MATSNGSNSEDLNPKELERPRYAVVLKTYTWDNFVARQVDRVLQSAPGGDFFLWIDESRASVGPVPCRQVVRTSKAKMVGEGWSDRSEKGAYFWWNADYPHYNFFSKHPGYDLYVFIEYDALLLGSIDRFVEAVRERGLDFVALPLREPLDTWAWTAGHRRTYGSEELQGCLMCISVQSGRALQILRSRRLAMAQQPSIPFWPSAEAFLPTEVNRAGLRSGSLEDFGDLSLFDWRPPLLEDDVVGRPGQAFVHPVYDRKRYVRWALDSGPTLRLLTAPDGSVRSRLVRFPLRTYLLPWLGAFGCALWRAAQHQWRQRRPKRLPAPSQT